MPTTTDNHTGPTDSHSHAVDDELKGLRERVARQEAELATQSQALAEILGRLEHIAASDAPVSAVAHVPETPGSTTLGSTATLGSTEHQGNVSRRGLLRAAAGVGAGAVALGIANARPAAAANGGNMVLGAANEAASQTRLYATTETTSLNGFSFGQLRVDGTNNSRGILAFGPTNGVGAVGVAQGTSGIGLWGDSDTGIGVRGTSNSGVDLYASGTGRVRLGSHLSAGPPVAGTYSTGEILRDSNGDFWVCTASGSPGTFRKFAVGGVNGVGQIHVLPTATRVGNTFSGSGITAGALGVNTERNVQVTGGLVPADALAVQGVLIAYSPSAFASPFSTSGDASIVKGGTSSGATVTLAWPSGAMYFSGAFVAQLDTSGRLTIGTRGSDSHFTVDVTAYYR